MKGLNLDAPSVNVQPFYVLSTPKCTNCRKPWTTWPKTVGRPACECKQQQPQYHNNNNRNNNNPRDPRANTIYCLLSSVGLQATSVATPPVGRTKNQKMGSDRSFVSTQFSNLINIAPTTLDHGYNVELADGCHKIFLAHITVKKTGDKSKKKQLEEVPIVKNFPEVFPEDLPGLPPTDKVKFHIDLDMVLHHVAHTAPYRLAPSEMKEVAESTTRASDKGFYKDLFHHHWTPFYSSRRKMGSLRFHEKNYTTHDQELGAVVFLLKILETYLYGTSGAIKQKSWNLVRMEPYASMAEVGYLVMTDGQSEITIQTLEDMLRACVIDFGNGWVKHLPTWLEKFNSPSRDRQETTERSFKLNKDQAARDRQKSYADLKRKPMGFELEIK
ncbi:hypothetical protein Tco_0212290 [Tanacetum coccineum]